MENTTAALLAMTALGLTALVAGAVYRWRQEQRAARIDRRVKDYLRARYGKLPDALAIIGSGDALWPVLVRFDAPHTGIRHRLQFSCGGTDSTFALLSEKEEPRQAVSYPSASRPKPLLGRATSRTGRDVRPNSTR
jgi:hypothetical protein